MKRKAGSCPVAAQQLEQALTLSLEELYCGCVKRMLLTRRVHNGEAPSARQKPSQEVLEVAVAPGWREGTRVTFHGEARCTLKVQAEQRCWRLQVPGWRLHVPGWPTGSLSLWYELSSLPWP
jgi:hypothetical protein